MHRTRIKAKRGSYTAKRLSNKAQGCRVSRLPWVQVVDASPTPKGLRHLSKLNIALIRQRRTECRHPLHGRAGRNPVGVAEHSTIRSQGCRAARLPWALLLNRFAVPDLTLAVPLGAY
jgi:hypothetical protein